MPSEPPPPYEVALGHPYFQLNAGSSSGRDGVILPPTVPPGGIESPATNPSSRSNPKFGTNEPVILQIPQYAIGSSGQHPNAGYYSKFGNPLKLENSILLQ